MAGRIGNGGIFTLSVSSVVALRALAVVDSSRPTSPVATAVCLGASSQLQSESRNSGTGTETRDRRECETSCTRESVSWLATVSRPCQFCFKPSALGTHRQSDVDLDNGPASVYRHSKFPPDKHDPFGRQSPPTDPAGRASLQPAAADRKTLRIIRLMAHPQSVSRSVDRRATLARHWLSGDWRSQAGL